MKTETKVSHTPGPWGINQYRELYNPYKIIIHAGPHRVALCFKDGNDVYVAEWQAEANARLIAAAPELLGALKNIVALNGVGYGTDVVQFVTDLQPFIIEAQNAIAKATDL